MCSFDIRIYLQKKADAVDVLICQDISVDENVISDQFLERLEKKFRLTDFLFFQSRQDDSDYHLLIADTLVYVNTSWFKVKYRSEGKTHKAHLVIKKQKGTGSPIIAIFAINFCILRSSATLIKSQKNYKGLQSKENPSIQPHTAAITNRTVRKLRSHVLLDPGAAHHFFCDEVCFVGGIHRHVGLLECASGNVPIT